MANTVIALKKSATPSSVPANLANGELAINYADGKLFYKAANGTIVEFASGTYSFGTINANGTLVVSDTPSDVLTLATGNNISIVGDAVNDKITFGLSNDVNVPGKLNVAGDFTHTGGSFYINNASGAGGTSEGGEIKFANATQNQVLSGPVSIDIYENKLRFFETNSPNRGAFINLASATAGVGSDLLAAASPTDTTARNAAGAAYDKANAANVLAFNALPNTTGATFNGNLTVSQNLTSDRVISLNNGNGENFKVGDDAWLGDTNLLNTVRLKGQQNASIGYILFGPNDGKLLGRSGTDNLTYDGNIIWHAGTDGAGSGLDADLLDGQHGTYYATATSVASAYDKANSANLLAFAALANTDNIIFGGTLNVTKNLTADKVITSNNGSSENFKIGDDVWIGDTNISNTFRIKGVQDPQQAYIIFNTVDTKALGRSGSGALTWDGGTIWHSSNDGTGSGLDADLLDGQHGSYYSTDAKATAAYDKANSANLLAYNTGIGANSFTSATIAGANTAVGTAANNFAIATIAGANTAVGLGANTYANATFVKLTTAEQTITGNVNIVGNLTLSGNTIVIEATTLQVDDPLLYLAANNYTSDIVDIGFIANYVNTTGANVHTGLYREHVNKEYYLFQGYDQEPINNHIGAMSNNMTLAVLNADMKTSNLSLGGQNTILWITSAYDKANTANITADLAYNKANAANVLAYNALPNTSGVTFNGSLNFPSGTVNVGSSIAAAPVNLQARASAGTAIPLRISGAIGGGTSNNTQMRFFGNGAQRDLFAIGTDIAANDGTVSFDIYDLAGGNRVRVDPTGNVGIGTLSPTSKLHVSGTANITSTLTVGTINVTNAIGASFDKANAANILAFNALANTAGITTAGTLYVPSALYVRGPNTIHAMIEYANTLIITPNSGNWGTSIRLQSMIATGDPDSIRFLANGKQLLFLNDDGYVGVGGSFTATANLHVLGNAIISTALTVGTINVTNAIGASFGKANAANVLAYSALPNTSGVSFNGNLNFPSGNVGIGTTSPAQNTKLHIVSTSGGLSSVPPEVSTIFQQNGTDASWSAASIVAGNTGQSRLYFSDKDSFYPGVLGYDHSSNYMLFNTNANERMRIDASGNVSIGTTSTAYKLEVNGNISSNGTVYATHFDNVSDKNLKYDITPINNAIDMIYNLMPVSFKWNDTNEKSYGLIAQDVEKIIPEIVHTKPDNTKTVSYIQLIPMLIEIIKQQQKQINEINSKLKSLPSNP